jgi:hypothetical protein
MDVVSGGSGTLGDELPRPAHKLLAWHAYTMHNEIGDRPMPLCASGSERAEIGH